MDWLPFLCFVVALYAVGATMQFVWQETHRRKERDTLEFREGKFWMNGKLLHPGKMDSSILKNKSLARYLLCRLP